MAVVPILDRVQALREAEMQDETIAAILGIPWATLAAYEKDPVGSPLPDPDLQVQSLRLAANGGATVLSANGASALTKDGTAVTVP